MKRIRDRIIGLRRVRAGDLVPNPDNWRRHPDAQQSALRAALRELGYADALIARQLPDGRLMLLDGHLRAALDPSAKVPVLVTDLSEEEGRKLLLTLDPLSAMAESDTEALQQVAAATDFESKALKELVSSLVAANPESAKDDDSGAQIPQTYEPEHMVLVRCEDEDQQRELIERLETEGYRCRALIS